jgi:hypothetical protein
MKVLWWTSFRPFGISNDNDNTQNIFLNSIKYYKSNITLIVTQFGEQNVKKSLVRQDINFIFKEYPKKKLPNKERFSNKIMCENALKEYCKVFSDYNYLIYSTCDIIVPNNLLQELNNIKYKNFMAYVFPNTLVKNSKMLKNIFPLYGIDLIVFKIDKIKANRFLELNKDWEQYGWGVNEHYFMSMKDALDLPSVNLWKKMDIIKFENDFNTFDESRSGQISEWKKNKNFFLKYLKKNNLSCFWALGSYYFIIFKHFNFRYLTLSLLIKYCMVFIQAPLVLIYKILRFKNYIK